jgi:multiple sugar transport system permease protein
MISLTLRQKQALWAWAFLALPVVFYVGVRFYPTAEAFLMSLTDWNIVGQAKFIGLANYERLAADPVFWKVMGNTFTYLAVGVTVSMLIAFVVAWYLDQMRFGHGLLRALYFIPHITTAVAMAWVWRWFYQPVPVGAFNDLLVSLGFAQQPFLRSTTQSLYAVLAPAIWASLGFKIVIFLAGLKAVPRHFYEAAEIDGAGKWRILFEITLPQLKPTIIFLAVVSSIGFLRIFDYVYAMTSGSGGPLDSTKPLVLMIFVTAFGQFDMGYAATQTVVLFAILLAISLAQLKLLRAT